MPLNPNEICFWVKHKWVWVVIKIPLRSLPLSFFSLAGVPCWGFHVCEPRVVQLKMAETFGRPPSMQSEGGLSSSHSTALAFCLSSTMNDFVPARGTRTGDYLSDSGWGKKEKEALYKSQGGQPPILCHQLELKPELICIETTGGGQRSTWGAWCLKGKHSILNDQLSGRSPNV